MKKLLALLLAAAMLLSLCACGSSGAPEKNMEDISDEDWEAAADALEDMYEETEGTTEPGEKIYELGETIVSWDGMVELTIDSFCFSDYKTSDSVLPAESGGYYDTAKEEMTFFLYTATFTLVGETKGTYYMNLSNIEVDYNDGYEFRSHLTSCRVFEEGERVEGVTNIIEIEPLVGTKVRELRGYIEVPEVIETDTEGALLLKFKIYGGVEGSGAFETDEITVRLR